MPSQQEMDEHRAKHNVRIIGIHPRAGSEPPLLGELVVIPYADHVRAMKAEYDRGREEASLSVGELSQFDYSGHTMSCIEMRSKAVVAARGKESSEVD
jgi:hypothetical protein